MRQAGRYLPEYRALKEKYSFLEMVREPTLAQEVTLQPLARFPLDAAIVFSDILVVPEAMGQGYGFHDKGGIRMDFAIETARDVERLEVEGAADRLDYVAKALALLRASLGNEKALLGFCGSPWTLACYAIAGGSSAGFPKALAFAKEQPHAFNQLMEKFTTVLMQYLRRQAEAGADAIQIFDTWGSLCPDGDSEAWSLRWIRELTSSLREEIPLILYAKDSANKLQELVSCGTTCLALDHSIDLAEAKNSLGHKISVQGNLDPELLESDPDSVRSAAKDLMSRMAPYDGHVFNLGHGIRPNAKVDCVEALAETVLGYSSGN
jgi:uroporphyrinogen decarboxylase